MKIKKATSTQSVMVEGFGLEEDANERLMNKCMYSTEADNPC
jgi:hypothetical protein